MKSAFEKITAMETGLHPAVSGGLFVFLRHLIRAVNDL